MLVVNEIVLNLLNLFIINELQLKSTGKCLNNASCQILNVPPEYSEKVFTACKGKLYILS